MQVEKQAPVNQVDNNRPVRGDREAKESVKPDKGDRFELTSKKEDLSNDGKFSWSQAFKNLGKGLVSPVTSVLEMFKSPTGFLLGAGMIGAGVALTATFPALVPVMLVAGGLFSAYELGKGVLNFKRALSRGDGDGMENAFKDVGAGVTGMALTVLGVKGSAGIAAEAKAVSKAYAAGVTDVEAITQGLIAKEQAKSFGMFRAFGENLSMCTKNGVSAVKAQRRSMLYKNSLQGSSKNISPVGKKQLTDDEVLQIAKETYDKEITKIAQELGVEESELRAVLMKEPVLKEGDEAARFLVGEDGSLSIELDPILKSYGISSVPESLIAEGHPLAFNSSSKEVIINYVAHEAGHLRSLLYRVKHLTIDETVWSIAYKVAVKDLAESGTRKMLVGIEGRMLKFFEAPVFLPRKPGYALRMRGDNLAMCDDFLTTNHIPTIAESIYDLVVKAVKTGEITTDINPRGLRNFLEYYPDFIKINNFTSEEEAIIALQETAIALQIRATIHSQQTNIFKNKLLVDLLKRGGLSKEGDVNRARATVSGQIDTVEETIKMKYSGTGKLFTSGKTSYFNTLEELSARSNSLLHRAQNLSNDVQLVVKDARKIGKSKLAKHIEDLNLRLRFLKSEQAVESGRYSQAIGTHAFPVVREFRNVIYRLEREIDGLMKLKTLISA